MDATADQLAHQTNLLDLGGQRFVVLAPTPRDMLAVGAKMKDLARARCCSPLDFVLKHQHLSAGALSLAVSEAIKLGSGGGVDPSPDAVWEQYATLAGVRWRVWYHVSRAHKDFTEEACAALVTEANFFDVDEKLNAALRLGVADPNAPAPATGSSS